MYKNAIYTETKHTTNYKDKARTTLRNTTVVSVTKHCSGGRVLPPNMVSRMKIKDE